MKQACYASGNTGTTQVYLIESLFERIKNAPFETTYKISKIILPVFSLYSLKLLFYRNNQQIKHFFVFNC